jgi:cytosine/adenosine deaminase-related metal-dependent hydrolase
MVAAGTALVCDVSNRGHTAPILDAAGLAGVVQHEVLGLGAPQWRERLAVALAPDREIGRIVVRPSPHATYSTAPDLIRAACRPGRVPATIHLSEDPHEAAFSERGEGPFADLVDALGLDWRWWRPPGCSPAAYLERLGVLGPGLLVVHGVWLTGGDRHLLRDRGSPLVLCARSNLHIGGRLPDVPALLADGVRLCLGTDSAASSPDLDVLGEIAVLARAFPAVAMERWLAMATVDAADALGFPEHGRIAVGAAPGLVLVEADDPRGLADPGVPRRRLR